MANQASKSCAREVVAHGERHGWTRWQMAVAIHKNCDCSLLKAQRLARLWTLEEMVREVVRTAELAGLPRPSLTTQRICHWEAGERPSPDYLDLLCRMFQTRPDRLGFGNDHTPAEDLEPPVTVVLPPALSRPGRAALPGRGGPDPGENEARRRTLLQASVGNRGVLSAPLLDAVDAIRRQGDEVFEKTAITVATLDRLEEDAEAHGAAYATTPPLTLLCDVVADYADVQEALAGRLPADFRQRLCRVAAQLAGLTALVFADVARSSQARGWFHLSHRAADETGDRRLRAWARAIEALEPFFNGDYPRALLLTQQAQALAGQTASPPGVLGSAIEARTLARIGRSSEALGALRRADEGYQRLAVDTDTSTWLGYPKPVHLYHRGDILTRLGMGTLARKALNEAAEVYSSSALRGRAYVEFCHAICDIQENQIADGCERALNTLIDVPVDCRVAMVKIRAKEVLEAVPPEVRSTRAVQHLKETLRDM
ncbi:MAG: hypothetical protein ACJ786_04950 [Catenulispora sp.]